MKTSSYILKTNREYAIYTCSHRAIPNIEDGLKPSQRMPLWLLRNKNGKIKVSALSGALAAEKIYVHGEASANNAISFLAAPFKNNVPLIEGEGMFGSRVVPDGIGAARYVEVRRAAAADKFLYQDLDLVPLMDNYDGTTKQPVHFLPLIPIALLNGVEGIATGWSTSIMPRAYRDLVDACIAVLAGKKIKPLVPTYSAFDVDVRSTGENQWEISGKVDINSASTVKITELPPGVKIESYLKSLDDMEDKGLITGFTDNSSDKIDIEVRFKRGTVRDWTPEKALTVLKLREKVTERIVVLGLGGNGVKQYDCAEDLVVDFVNWRLGWYTTRYEKMVSDATHELRYWELLKVLVEKGFTKKLGTFESKKAMEEDIAAIAKKNKLTVEDSHIDRVVNLPTYRWTKDFEITIGEKVKDFSEKVTLYTNILNSPVALKAIYVRELEEIRKL